MKKIILSIGFLACLSLGFSQPRVELDMVKIPGQSFNMLKTEVTQELYESVMGVNPSNISNKIKDKYHVNDEDLNYEVIGKFPIDCVSWYDAIYFCNKLSKMLGLSPVYAVNGETDVSK